MKTCLNCQEEFPYKKEAAKFCSAKCRVMYNRKNPKNQITKTQMEVLYNATLEVLGELKEQGLRRIDPMPPAVAVAVLNAGNKSQHTEVVTYDYEGLKRLIMASTSAYDLEQAWKAVKAASWLAGWQLRELTKLRELQQTKIDF